MVLGGRQMLGGLGWLVAVDFAGGLAVDNSMNLNLTDV